MGGTCYIIIYIYTWSKHTGCSKFWRTELWLTTPVRNSPPFGVFLSISFNSFPCHPCSGTVWYGSRFVSTPACLAAWSWRWHISSIQYSVCLPQSDTTTKRLQAQTGLRTSNEKRAQLQKLGTGKEDQDGQVTVWFRHVLFFFCFTGSFAMLLAFDFLRPLFVSRPHPCTKSQSKVWPHATSCYGCYMHSSVSQLSGLSSDLQSAAAAVNRGVLKGSATGTAYAPQSPILSQVLSPASDVPPTVTPESAPPLRQADRAGPGRALRSLVELKQLSVRELKQMLDERGVGHSSRDKDDLASWVHQHQDLPKVNRSKPVGTSHSLQELKKMSVKELREMLVSRGVSEGSATEKSDLATWVWQHQHLPVLSDWKSRQKARKHYGFGPGGEGRDSTSEAKDKPEVEKIEANETKQIEGDDTKLLEGATSEKPTWPFRLAVLATIGVLAVLVGAVAANDAMQVEDENDCRAIRGCGTWYLCARASEWNAPWNCSLQLSLTSYCQLDNKESDYGIHILEPR